MYNRIINGGPHRLVLLHVTLIIDRCIHRSTPACQFCVIGSTEILVGRREVNHYENTARKTCGSFNLIVSYTGKPAIRLSGVLIVRLSAGVEQKYNQCSNSTQSGKCCSTQPCREEHVSSTWFGEWKAAKVDHS